MPKHVASRTLRDPGWNATVLGPDPAEAIARLKQQPHLWYVPAVVGAGQRLFEGVDTSSLDLRLMDERRLGNGNGSVMLSYAVG
jgi:hypothetical protein